MHALLRKIYRTLFRPDPLKRLIERGLIVGKNFHAQDDVIIDSSHCWHIEIGDDVTLAPRVHVLAHDASTKLFLGFTKIGKVKIGNRVFIGASTTILPGVTIGDDVIVGAGSIVSRDIPSGVVAVGNPARVVEPLADFLARRRQEMECVPVFGEEYALRSSPTPEMRQEMNTKMETGVGYLI